MAKIQDYFKIVTPKPGITTMSDSQNLGDQGVYANYTWYQRLVQGSASRLTRYREYDLMDNDVEIARSLDTIAEEMIGSNPNTDLPLELVIESEKNQEVSTSMVMTLRAALRYWSDLHDWNIRLFKVARTTIKYGDCFFIRKKETAKWEYVHSKNVVAAIVDDRDMTRVLGWQIKRDTKVPNSPYNQPVGHFGNYSNELVDTFPADDVVWFTLNDDISETAPFGESVLRAVYRAQKQKELLEDAIIIYRIQRAPERRVFYIDVGKMSPNRVKTYLESIKNEIRQRKVPTAGGGVDQVDSVYNPQCLTLDTKIPLLDGRTLTLQEMISEFEEGKQNWTYSINPNTGAVVPGLVSWAGVTRKDTETIKLTLDNGEVIVCTPDHKIPVQGRGKIEAKDLLPTDSLWPFNTRQEKINKRSPDGCALYNKVYNPETKDWDFVHRLVTKFMENAGVINEFVFNPKYATKPKNLIHHKDFNAENNSPENLWKMHNKDHSYYHYSMSKNQEAVVSDRVLSRFVELANKDINILFDDLLVLINNDSILMNHYEEDNQPKEGMKFKIDTKLFQRRKILYCLRLLGHATWKDYQNTQIVNEIKKISEVGAFLGSDYAQDHINLIQFVLKLVQQYSMHNFALVTHLKSNEQELNNFITLYKKVFEKSTISVPEASMFERIAKLYNYSSFKHLIKEAANFNHRVIKIEKDVNQDVGTLTIDNDHKYHNYHNFAISAGCYVQNSMNEDFFFAQRPDGRGSKVETLPGGQGLGELADLEYFQWKVFRGLRIPLSYMREGQDGAMASDGKVGIAYIQELRFAMYIKRLQNYLSRVIDAEFKRYLRMAGITADPTIFNIKLPDPENFGIYRQQQLDNDLLSTYGQANGVEHLSKRFTMKKYLQATDEEILLNQRMRAEELGLDPDNLTKEDFIRLYSPPQEGGMDMGMGGGMTAGTLGGLGGGMDMGMMPPEGGEMGGLGAETGTPAVGGVPPNTPAPTPTQ